MSGCAVYCEKKLDYITQITNLAESLQQNIMQAIQQLDEVTSGPGRQSLSLLSLDADARVIKLESELDAMSKAKEAFAQQYHNLQQQVQSLLEEKQILITENQQLSNQMKEKESVTLTRSPDNRRQIECLKEEIYKLVSIRDDYTAKMLEQEKEIKTLQEKVSELQLAAEATSRLKDEVDVLSESVEKVQVLENTVTSYKKKLEEYGDIKKQMKVLEEKNYDYLQKNLKYEEELKKHNMWKNQSEVYKEQIADLQQKLDEETRKLDKITFLHKNSESKLEALQCEKDRILQERDILREEMDEIKLGNQKYEGGAAMSQELVPTNMKERLRMLEVENETLRNVNQEAEKKLIIFDDLQIRLEKLKEQNRHANHKILELENQLEENGKQQGDAHVHILESTLKEYKQKLATQQEAYAGLQNRYTRSVEKAREVAMNLEPKTNGSLDVSLRQNTMKEQEEKLIVSAMFHMGLNNHRENVDEKLAVLSAGQGQSFLQRQRQLTPRKPLTPFKSK